MGFVKREPWIKSPKVKHDKGTDYRPTFSLDEWAKLYLALLVIPADTVPLENSLKERF